MVAVGQIMNPVPSAGIPLHLEGLRTGERLKGMMHRLERIVIVTLCHGRLMCVAKALLGRSVPPE